MLKKELMDTVRSVKTWITAAVLLLLPMADLVRKVLYQYEPYWQYPEMYPEGLRPTDILHPSFAGFLAGGIPTHAFQQLWFWIVPIWCLLLYGDSCVREYHCKYDSLLDTRISKRKVFWTKNLAGFLIGFAVTLASVLVNYLLCVMIFPGTSFSGFEQLVGSKNATTFFDFSMTHPILIYCVYMLSFSIISGLTCCMSVSLCMLLRSYKLAYCVAFVIWFPQVSMSSRGTIIEAIQPYSLADISFLIHGITVFLISVVVTVILGYIRKVKYETL